MMVRVSARLATIEMDLLVAHSSQVRSMRTVNIGQIVLVQESESVTLVTAAAPPVDIGEHSVIRALMHAWTHPNAERRPLSSRGLHTTPWT